MSKFWQSWLLVWCGAIGVFGLMLAGAGLAATDWPSRILFDFLDGARQFELDSYMRFSLAVLGAVTVGWSLTLLAAIQAAQQLAWPLNRPIWALITASVMSWFVIDSTLSVTTGFWLNAVLNLFFVAAFLVAMMSSGVFRHGRVESAE